MCAASSLNDPGTLTSMPRRPGSVDPPLEPFPRVHLARNVPRAVVARMIRSGGWVKVRTGAYVVPPPEADRHARRRFLALAGIVAAARQLTIDHTFSHASAALVWGLPLWTVPDRTHLIQGPTPTGTGAVDLARHVHELATGHRTRHRGLPVTTLDRTLVDCAMSLGPLGGLVVADAALRAGADRDRCRALLASMAGRRGTRVGRAVVELADGGAESPRETATRYVMLRSGMPAPETQIHITTPIGDYWADLGWRDLRLLVEYDGIGKYAEAAGASEVLLRERRRQDAVQEQGWRFLRLTREDFGRTDTIMRRLTPLLPRALAASLTPRPDLIA